MRAKENSLATLYVILIAMLLSSCAATELAGPKEKFSEANLPELEEQQARLIVYRDKKDKKKKAVAPVVRVDGRLIGALNSGQYLVGGICSGENTMQVIQRTENGAEVNVSFDSQESETLYFRIEADEEDSFQIEPVSEKQAVSELKKIKNTSYLASRASAECFVEEVVEEIEEPVQEIALIKEVSLAADTLFSFGGSELNKLANEKQVIDPYQALDALVDDVKEYGVTVSAIKVVGHSDRLGNADYNQRLSERRAQTVATYLRSKGLEGNIEVSGLGSTSPVTTDCKGTAATPELIRCLQPDRRVSIELWGSHVSVTQSDDKK